MLLNVVRPSLLLSAALLAGTLHGGRWRLLIGTIQASYCLFIMSVLEVTRQHATLYTNLMIALQLIISSASPRSGAWVMHGAAFISAHTLFFGYLMALYAAGDGLAAGFDVIDLTQWRGDLPMACEASFVLHVLPVVLVHLDLNTNRSDLAAAYLGTSWCGHLWSVLSSLILPLTYQFIMEARHGSLTVAMHTLYRIPTNRVETLLHAVRAMNLLVGATGYGHVWKRLFNAAAMEAHQKRL